MVRCTASSHRFRAREPSFCWWRWRPMRLAADGLRSGGFHRTGKAFARPEQRRRRCQPGRRPERVRTFCRRRSPETHRRFERDTCLGPARKSGKGHSFETSRFDDGKRRFEAVRTLRRFAGSKSGTRHRVFLAPHRPDRKRYTPRLKRDPKERPSTKPPLDPANRLWSYTVLFRCPGRTRARWYQRRQCLRAPLSFFSRSRNRNFGNRHRLFEAARPPRSIRRGYTSFVPPRCLHCPKYAGGRRPAAPNSSLCGLGGWNDPPNAACLFSKYTDCRLARGWRTQPSRQASTPFQSFSNFSSRSFPFFLS